MTTNNTLYQKYRINIMTNQTLTPAQQDAQATIDEETWALSYELEELELIQERIADHKMNIRDAKKVLNQKV